MDLAILPSESKNYVMRSSIIYLILFTVVLVTVQPNFMFYKDSDDIDRYQTWYKPLGVSPHQSIMPVWLAMLLFSIVIYLYHSNKKKN